jgi:hypothetical protein
MGKTQYKGFRIEGQLWHMADLGGWAPKALIEWSIGDRQYAKKITGHSNRVLPTVEVANEEAKTLAMKWIDQRQCQHEWRDTTVMGSSSVGEVRREVCGGCEAKRVLREGGKFETVDEFEQIQ